MDHYRFFLPDLLTQAAQPHALLRLPEDQAHHARSVLRLEPGAQVILFDGNGAWAHALIPGDPAAKLPKHSLQLHLQGGITFDPAPAISLTLASAVPKGDRAEWLVEQASQLNVAALQWLTSDRAVVKPREGGGKIDKWRRLAIESAKQCARTRLLQISEPQSLETILQQAFNSQQKILWLEPQDSDHSRRVRDVIDPDQPAAILALIGPEGGWSTRELLLLNAAASQNRLTRIRLTPTILRIETACAALAALITAR